ncbi:hypothetical protein Tco_0400268 [Tanacetum coccineum]
MKELRLDDKLNFVEEPIEIMDREVKQLKQSHTPIVKVRWNSKRGPEFTWEREDQIRAKLHDEAVYFQLSHFCHQSDFPVKDVDLEKEEAEVEDDDGDIVNTNNV